MESSSCLLERLISFVTISRILKKLKICIKTGTIKMSKYETAQLIMMLLHFGINLYINFFVKIPPSMTRRIAQDKISFKKYSRKKCPFR